MIAPGELGRRGDDLVDDARLLLATCTEPRTRPHTNERSADVILEDDDDDEDDRREQPREQVHQRDELRVFGPGVDHPHDGKANAHLHRARPAQHEQRAVDHVSDDDDVDEIAHDFERRARSEQVQKALRHRGLR